MNLRGKAAVITGSGGDGSGRAIACRFAQEGANVVVSDINEAGGLETARRIAAAGGQAAFFRADVQVRQQVRDLIAFTQQRFHALDVLVNNASGPEYRPDQPFEHWDEIVQTDLLGTMYGIRCAIDAMRRNGGAIVNISSISALWHGRRTPAPAVPAYDAAKAGVMRLTTMLGWLGTQEKIRVNCFAPGWIGTLPVQAYWESLSAGQREERGVPARLLRLDEVAGAVVRLATDESLSGRVMLWWSTDAPRLIAWGDRGYGEYSAL
jgi:NAD(P)-dependent dehydrogenase (short-subunit alcohol dehydrogenase family)